MDGITEKCRLEKKDPTEDDIPSINIFKFELIKLCIERVLSEDIEDDETIGAFGAGNGSVSFKIAYNTLIKNEILIEDNYDEHE